MKKIYHAPQHTNVEDCIFVEATDREEAYEKMALAIAENPEFLDYIYEFALNDGLMGSILYYSKVFKSNTNSDFRKELLDENLGKKVENAIEDWFNKMATNIERKKDVAKNIAKKYTDIYIQSKKDSCERDIEPQFPADMIRFLAKAHGYRFFGIESIDDVEELIIYK